MRVGSLNFLGCVIQKKKKTRESSNQYIIMFDIILGKQTLQFVVYVSNAIQNLKEKNKYISWMKE